ncbi:MAG: hypothetical protein AMXMBFR46_15370 [Acidimicrobiia bacterium]
MAAPHSPGNEERTNVSDGDARSDPTASPRGSEPPSGHALGGQNKGTLVAFAIVSGVVLLFVIVGAILRAVN